MEYTGKLTGAALAFSLQGKLACLSKGVHYWEVSLYNTLGMLSALVLINHCIHTYSIGDSWSEVIELDLNAITRSSAKLISCPEIRIKLVEDVALRNDVHSIPKYVMFALHVRT